MISARERLKVLFRDRALQFGHFTLASGKQSHYYINSKKVLFHSEAISLLGELIYESTKDLSLQAIGGLEVGAIPLAIAALASYDRHGRALEGFFVRKRAKDHGSRELIEGVLHPNDRVAVVDDVLTTGGSVLQAIEAVEHRGAVVACVLCICDRLQGAAAALSRYDYRPLLTVKDFGIEPENPESPANL